MTTTDNAAGCSWSNKNFLSYLLYIIYQLLSASEGPVKISPAVSEIKKTERLTKNSVPYILPEILMKNYLFKITNRYLILLICKD